MRCAMSDVFEINWPFRGFSPLKRPPSQNPLLLWLDRQKQRRALIALDLRLLDDIGVSSDAARQEAQRWD